MAELRNEAAVTYQGSMLTRERSGDLAWQAQRCEVNAYEP